MHKRRRRWISFSITFSFAGVYVRSWHELIICFCLEQADQLRVAKKTSQRSHWKISNEMPYASKVNIPFLINISSFRLWRIKFIPDFSFQETLYLMCNNLKQKLTKDGIYSTLAPKISSAGLWGWRFASSSHQ